MKESSAETFGSACYEADAIPRLPTRHPRRRLLRAQALLQEREFSSRLFNPRDCPRLSYSFSLFRAGFTVTGATRNNTGNNTE